MFSIHKSRPRVNCPEKVKETMVVVMSLTKGTLIGTNMRALDCGNIENGYILAAQDLFIYKSNEVELHVYVKENKMELVNLTRYPKPAIRRLLHIACFLFFTYRLSGIV